MHHNKMICLLSDSLPQSFAKAKYKFDAPFTFYCVVYVCLSTLIYVIYICEFTCNFPALLLVFR